MKAGRYVGRIGELAAVLGVGIALSLAAPTAWADDDTSSSSDSPSTSASADSDSPESGAADSEATKTNSDAEDEAKESDDDADTETVDIDPVMTAADEAPGDAPEDDVESPITWVVAAAARRELDPSAAVEDENEKPSITDVNVGTPSSTGTVTGKIVASDADGDRLRYSATSTANGTVSVNSSTGTFRYRPTAAARHAAAAVTNPVTQDTIVVTVDDRNGGVVTQSVLVSIAPKNSAPILFASTRSPSSSSGAVTSRLSGIDFDRDALQYGTPATTSKGAITFDPATRTLVYTPTDAAREAAAAAGAPSSAKTDTFTVTVSDGHGGVTTKTVSVRISPKSTAGPATGTGVSRIGDVSVPGYAEHQAYSAAGSRSVIVSDATDYSSDYSTTKVIVVDNSTARQVGSTLTLNGVASGPPLFNASRTRAVIYTNSQIAVINATTGAQIGTTLNFTYPPPALSPTGERAVFTSTNPNSPGVSVRVIDTSSGAQIGTTTVLDLPKPGDPNFSWTPDGSRVLVSSQAGDWDSGFTTYAHVVDVNTGEKAIPLNGFQVSGRSSFDGTLFNAAGTRAVLVTEGFDQYDKAITRVAGINMVTGEQIGTTVTLTGALVSALKTADNGRVVVTTRPNSNAPQPNSSLVAVVDIATGNQLGTTLALAGTATAAALNSATTRAIVAHQDFAGHTTSVTVVDTATGKQVGSTVILNGGLTGVVSRFVTVDGAHALVATNTGEAVILNTLNGTRTALTVTGEVRGFRLAGSDGSRAVITTGNEATESTFVAVVDTATGAQIGTTVTVSGNGYGGLVSGGNRMVITTYHRELFTGSESTRIATIDTTTGKLVGSVITLDGETYDAQLLSPTSTRALITVSEWNPFTYNATTRLLVIDMTTGKQSGSTIAVTGDVSVAPTFSPDRTRAVLTTSSPDLFIRKESGRVTVLRIT